MTVTAALYDEQGVFVKNLDLTTFRDVSWVDERRGPGGGSIEFHPDHPDAGHFAPHRSLLVSWDGVGAFRWTFQDMARRRLAANAADKLVRWEGPGALALLDEAVVEGDGDTGYKTFGWPADEWDETGWTAGANWGTVAAPDIFVSVNEDFMESLLVQLAPNTERMWATALTDLGGGVMGHPAGNVWGRQDMDLTGYTGKAKVLFAADDGIEIWWGGEPKGIHDTGIVTAHEFLVDVDDETVQLAVRGRNGVLGAKPANPGLVSVSVVAWDTATNEGGEVLATLNSSESVWVESQPDGVTFGYVMGRLIDEAQTRGCLPLVGYSFTDDLDSEGAAWSESVSVARYRDGEHLGAVVRDGWHKFVGHSRMQPDLQLWLGGSSGDNLSATTEIVAREATLRRTAPEANVLRLDTDGGTGWAVHSGRVAEDGRRIESAANFGQAFTADEVTSTALALLNKEMRGRVEQTLDTHEGDTVEPYAGYLPGDTVGVSEGSGAQASLVERVAVTVERNGQATVQTDTARFL